MDGKLFLTAAFSFFLSDPFIWVLDFTLKGFVNIVIFSCRSESSNISLVGGETFLDG